MSTNRSPINLEFVLPDELPALSPTPSRDGEDAQQIFLIRGMDCANCALTIERGVASLPDVETCTLNFASERLVVSGAVSQDAILERVRALGYGGDVFDPNASVPTSAQQPQASSFWRYLLQSRNTRLALLGALLILPGLLFDELAPLLGITVSSPIWRWFSLAALIVAGAPIARNAWRALVINREITINLLMTIAAGGALILGAWTEAGLVMVLFAIGETLEGYSVRKVRSSISTLLEQAPQEAIVLRPCIDCQGHMGQDGYTGGPCPVCGTEEQRVAVQDVRVGEQMLVRPGDEIALDGVVIEGESEVTQARITGESMPVFKEVGSEVFAGAFNGSGALTIEVTQPASNSLIARIVRMVDDAMDRRAPVQRTVDRFARYYTPTVVATSLLLALLPPLLLGAPFWGDDGWFYRSLTLLVVACPCALVLSTPVTLVSALSRLAALGVLVKGGEIVERMSEVSAVAFDKTGTLTQGTPQVLHLRAAACTTAADDSCPVCIDFVGLASAVERRSEHPLARAILAYAEGAGVSERYAPATSVQAVTGRGVHGIVDGRKVIVGSHSWFEATVPHPQEVCEIARDASEMGATPLLVADNGLYAGYLLLADTVRAESAEAIAQLRAMGISDLAILTGDNQGAAHHIAAQVGIKRVYAELLPGEKIAEMEKLKREGTRVVAMVGDGVNDAPALAAADVGIAMGEGAAHALDTADVVLPGNDLRLLPKALKVARHALKTVHANIWLSVLSKLAVFVVVLLGFGSMWLAILVDVGLSLLVTLNGMRLLRYTPEVETIHGD